jgi:cyanophycin synthetase
VTVSQEMLPMHVLDSRRLTGPGLILDGPGAVLEVRLDESVRGQAVAAWERAARQLLETVGWTKETLKSRAFAGGVSLALTAPIDGLYAATELNEQAWAAAAAELRGEKTPDLRAAAASVLDELASERNPLIVTLCKEAKARSLTFLVGEDLISVGSGTGALLWQLAEPPDPTMVDWSSAHEVPIVLVTGSNGKTTVVRLLGAIVQAAGRTVGLTSTDGVTVGETLLEEGDFAGPSGARLVLRHPETETAILETARGGILRRGLPVDHAGVAVVTNIADDHLGEYGIESLADLADTKLVVAKTLGTHGTLVLNADDPLLVERSRSIDARLSWFSLNPPLGIVARDLERGGTALVVEDGAIVLREGGQRRNLIDVADIPITFGGIATHNVANVLAAAAAATALGIEADVIAGALKEFGRDLDDNPGRANLLDLGGVRLLLDFAHNPHGMSAIVKLAQTIPASRRLLLVGQAGDRNDDAIRALARSAW